MAGGIESLLADLLVDRVAQQAPALDRAVHLKVLHRLDRPVQGDPGHHLRVGEVPPRAAHLPDALVRALPGRLDEGHQSFFEAPPRLVRLQAEAPGVVHDIEDLAIDIELELAGGGVADAHRAGAAVAREPR